MRSPLLRRLLIVFLTLGISYLSFVAPASASGSRNRLLSPRGDRAALTPRDRALPVPKTARPSGLAACRGCEAGVNRNGKKQSAKSRPKAAKKFACHPKGYVDPRIGRNFNRALSDMRRAGLKPEITSTWRSSEEQARLYRCTRDRRCRRANPGLYSALPPGTSVHEAGLAVDVSGVASGRRGAKRLTPQGRKIVRIMQKHGFRWRYGLSDPPHFEADPRRHGYRSLSQAIKRSQTTCQANLVSNKPPARRASNAKNAAGPGPTLAARRPGVQRRTLASQTARVR